MINVVRLPKELDIDKRIWHKMLEVYGTCPYCANEDVREEASYHWTYDRDYNSSVTYEEKNDGERSIGKTGLFKKKEYKWKKIRFHCRRCDMVWDSPSYPIVGNDTDANNAIFHAWQRGKNMEVNTLLLTVIDKKEK